MDYSDIFCEILDSMGNSGAVVESAIVIVYEPQGWWLTSWYLPSLKPHDEGSLNKTPNPWGPQRVSPEGSITYQLLLLSSHIFCWRICESAVNKKGYKQHYGL